MEKHPMEIFGRACLILTALAFTPIAANAQLLNGSFESPGTNFIYQPDAFGVIITNTEADSWSGDPMADFGAGVVGFGTLQVAFLDVSNNIIGSADSRHLDTNTVLNTWISCSATGTAPAGTVQVRAYALHVGMSGALGSIFW